jgi:hypothetical protein
MRVLLVSEGIHEEAGALEALVRRVASKISSCTCARVSDPRVRAHHGKGQGYKKRALRWMLQARDEGYDSLILVIDRDRYPERVEELNEAQQEHVVTNGFPRAVGIAIRSFDAWMLADEKALSSVLGSTVPMQPSPEDISDPKGMCAELLQRSTHDLKQRELYANIAKEVDLQRLEQRCPLGFAIFAARLRRL